MYINYCEAALLATTINHARIKLQNVWYGQILYERPTYSETFGPYSPFQADAEIYIWFYKEQAISATKHKITAKE